MNKKQLRKQLEQTLVKAIEDVLNKNNGDAAKKTGKTVHEASKIIAKKFYKSLSTEIKAVTEKAKAMTIPAAAASKAPSAKGSSGAKKAKASAKPARPASGKTAARSKAKSKSKK